MFSNSLVVKAEEPKVEIKEEQEKLLQFSSNGSMVGFNQEGVIVASKDKALKIGFVNPNKVSPISNQKETEKIQELDTVTYTNLWEGVDVKYEKTLNSVLKSTYFLNNPDKVNNIVLAYNRPVELDNKGNLIIKFDTDTITEQAPTAYQETPQGKHIVNVSFNLQPNNTVGFTISNFLPNLPIVIDPALAWNTFLGGGGTEVQNYSMTLDTSNIYITGASSATWGSPVRSYTSGNDAFVVKLDSSGNLTWNTFLGGSGTDVGLVMTLDANINIYVAGYSSATWGSPVRSYTSGNDAFVVKLDSTGALTWNTFVGASGTDAIYSISLDTTGNIFISGRSAATWGSPVRSYTSGDDMVVAKLDNNGNLTWNTFLGGSGTDLGYSNTLDSTGNIYVIGSSNATWGSPVSAYTLGTDAIIVKLDNNGNLTWNTFLGGSGTDTGYSLILDTSENIYFGGISSVTWGTPIRNYTLGDDAFVAKLDNDPFISSVISIAARNSSVVTWTTNEASSSKVDYGLTSSYESTTSEADTGTGVTSHSATLSGLSDCTIYYFRVRSKDSVLNETVGNSNSFKTNCAPGPSICNTSNEGLVAPYLYNAIAQTPTSVLLLFGDNSTNVTDYYLEYGTKSGQYQFGTGSIGGKGTTSYTVKSLSPSTTYYFRVRGGNGCASGPWSNEVSTKIQNSNLKTQTYNSKTQNLSIDTTEQIPSLTPVPIKLEEDINFLQQIINFFKDLWSKIRT